MIKIDCGGPVFGTLDKFFDSCAALSCVRRVC